MSTRSRNPGRLQTSYSRPHDDNTFLFNYTLQWPIIFGGRAQFWIMYTGNTATQMHFTPTIITGNTRPYLVSSILPGFVWPFSITQQNPTQTDQIPIPFYKRVFCFLRGPYPPHRHNRYVTRYFPHPAMQLQIRARLKMHIRQMIFQACGRISLAKCKIIKLSHRNKALNDFLGFIRINSPNLALIAGHFEADQKLFSTFFPYFLDQLLYEFQAPLTSDAIFIIPII